MTNMPDALTVIQAFQDTEGYSDDAVTLLLTDFINAEKLGNALQAYLATRRGDESLKALPDDELIDGEPI